MATIERNPAAAAQQTYDLIIIGGGIYGACLALETIRCGRQPLLLEQKDFGGATSFNHLRILHGGFRYLQSLDLPRFRESVGERSWYLRHFPALTRPMPCLMPLYNQGVRRPSVFRLALKANDFLSRTRNLGVVPELHLREGRVLSAEKTREVFPAVRIQGLAGGAVWWDVCMPDSTRILMEILRWACLDGATALNYVEVIKLLNCGDGSLGILARDRETGAEHEYRGQRVVNAAGPWSRDVAKDFDRDIPDLFRSSLAWNILFDRPSLSDHALAVTPDKPGGRTYFIVPWKGRLLVGTGHAPWQKGLEGLEQPGPTSDQLEEFLTDLNMAIPSLKLSQTDILRVFSGLLPATEEGGVKLSAREVLIDHGAHGGPKGFFSVSGVKFTTARLVAEKTVKRLFPQDANRVPQNVLHPQRDGMATRGLLNVQDPLANNGQDLENILKHLISDEAAVHLEDLVFRRTNLWESPQVALTMAQRLSQTLAWPAERKERELLQLRKSLDLG